MNKGFWPDRIRIRFETARDSNGYPPTGVESLWGFKVTNGTYEIDNVPFYVRDISLGDHVTVRRDEDGFMFQKLVARSPHSTVRVAVSQPSMLDAIRSELRSLGCDSEINKQLNLLAVDLPNTADVKSVLEFLDAEYSKGILDFEESSVRYQ